MIALNDEARRSMVHTLDALQQWSNEIRAVNDHCLTKVIDHMEAAQRAVGWPDHATTATGQGEPGIMHYFLLFTVVRDTLQQACKLQTDVIDKVAEGCFSSRLI
jgi:hypothetical protein